MDLGFLITQSLYNQVMKKNSTVLIEISALLKRNVIPNKWSNRTDVKINLKIDGGGNWKDAGIGRDRAVLLFKLTRAPVYTCYWGFPGGSVVMNPPANAGDKGSIPESRRFPGEVNSNLVQ